MMLEITSPPNGATGVALNPFFEFSGNSNFSQLLIGTSYEGRDVLDAFANSPGPVAVSFYYNDVGFYFDSISTKIDLSGGVTYYVTAFDDMEMVIHSTFTTAGGVQKVATPTIDPNGGSFISSTSATLSCSTGGAAIHYTTNGDTPTSSSTLYTGAISITASMTLKCIAIKDGMTDSDVASASFTISVASPIPSPAGNTFYNDVAVSISCSTSGAEIRYTTNGDTPTGASTLYSSLFTITASSTLKALGIKSGLDNSTISTNLYTLSCGTTQFSPSNYQFAVDGPSTVTLSNSTSGCEIRYTTDGSTPTGSSALYSGPIVLTNSYSSTSDKMNDYPHTITATAIKTGYATTTAASWYIIGNTLTLTAKESEPADFTGLTGVNSALKLMFSFIAVKAETNMKKDVVINLEAGKTFGGASSVGANYNYMPTGASLNMNGKTILIQTDPASLSFGPATMLCSLNDMTSSPASSGGAGHIKFRNLKWGAGLSSGLPLIRERTDRIHAHLENCVVYIKDSSPAMNGSQFILTSLISPTVGVTNNCSIFMTTGDDHSQIGVCIAGAAPFTGSGVRHQNTYNNIIGVFSNGTISLTTPEFDCAKRLGYYGTLYNYGPGAYLSDAREIPLAAAHNTYGVSLNLKSNVIQNYNDSILDMISRDCRIASPSGPCYDNASSLSTSTDIIGNPRS